MASRVGTVTNGFLRIVRNPSMVANPTRRPVKDPGPIDMANPSKSLSAKPAVRSASSMETTKDFACEPSASRLTSARTVVSFTIATL